MNTISHYMIPLKELGDSRGGMAVVNSQEEIPFGIKRAFYCYHTDQNAERGNHANINSSFVMISLAGSCSVMVDDGSITTDYLLGSPLEALYIGKGLWKTMHRFSSDNILLVLSDCNYDPNEYIRDYEQYVLWTQEGKR